MKLPHLQLKFLTQIRQNPASVKELVNGQHIKKSAEKLAEQEAKQQELLEKINCTSKLVIPAVLSSAACRKKPEKRRVVKSEGARTQGS